MNPVDELIADNPVALAGVGDRLRAAREARGLTIADIAQTLKFSPRQVELVEGNAWVELPGQTFVRGCVRNYARMLQLDPQPLLKDLESANLPKAAVLALPGSTNATLPAAGQSRGTDLAAVVGGLVLVVLALVVYFLVPEDIWRGKLDAVARKPVSTTAVASMPTAVPPTAAEAPPATEPAPPAAAAAAPSASPATAAADPAQGGVNAVLRFEFDQASWVEVRDSNGALLHSQNNAAGSVQEVNGTIPLSIIIGDARRVRMVYKDKPVDLAPYTNPQNNVARLNIE